MPSEADGKRILITRLWPLDVDTYFSKIDLWLKDLAPSYLLLEWFREHPKDWDGFRERYLKELEYPSIKKILEELFEQGQKEDITLLYANETPEKSPAGIVYQVIDKDQKSEVRNQKSNRGQVLSCFSFFICLLTSAFCFLFLGCSSTGDYSPSMDYNPGWENDRNTVTSFDQLPRHKNRLEHGIH